MQPGVRIRFFGLYQQNMNKASVNGMGQDFTKYNDTEGQILAIEFNKEMNCFL